MFECVEKLASFSRHMIDESKISPHQVLIIIESEKGVIIDMESIYQMQLLQSLLTGQFDLLHSDSLQVQLRKTPKIFETSLRNFSFIFSSSNSSLHFTCHS